MVTLKTRVIWLEQKKAEPLMTNLHLALIIYFIRNVAIYLRIATTVICIETLE